MSLFCHSLVTCYCGQLGLITKTKQKTLEGYLWMVTWLDGRIWTKINVLTSNLIWLGGRIWIETLCRPEILLYNDKICIDIHKNIMSSAVFSFLTCWEWHGDGGIPGLWSGWMTANFIVQCSLVRGVEDVRCTETLRWFIPGCWQCSVQCHQQHKAHHDHQ